MVHTEGGRPMFKRAYVEITNVCNLACSFCPGTRRSRRFMASEEFAVIAGKLRPHTEYLYLHVMGEPLLHPQLWEILGIAESLGFRVCITTNGTLLPEKGALLRRPCIHKVSISLHSFEGNGDGDMTDYLNGVWQFAESAPSIVALRLWNGGGQNSRNGEIIAFLSKKCGADIDLLPCDRNGNRRLRENIYLESAEKFDWPTLDTEERGTEFCHGLRQQIAVLCDGTVVPCCLDHEGDIPLGDLLQQSPEDILSSPRAQALREGFSRRCPAEELCRRCGYATRFNQ